MVLEEKLREELNRRIKAGANVYSLPAVISLLKKRKKKIHSLLDKIELNIKKENIFRAQNNFKCNVEKLLSSDISEEDYRTKLKKFVKTYYKEIGCNN